jgi:hypothetical protein
MLFRTASETLAVRKSMSRCFLLVTHLAALGTNGKRSTALLEQLAIAAKNRQKETDWQRQAVLNR